MAKSNRSLWTQKIVEGKTQTLTGNSTWTSDIIKKTQKQNDKFIADKKRSIEGKLLKGIVLGIDPSLRGTGLGIVESLGDGQIRYIESVTVKNNPMLTMPECLARILDATTNIIKKHKPMCVAIEQSVYVQNFRTAIILGASRGASIAACASAGLEVFEYPPLRIKQAVIGYGRASKDQIVKSVAAIVKDAPILPSDEADAVGAAMAHIYTKKS